MDVRAFRASLTQTAPPAGLSAAAQALWWDARGNWEKAHQCVQDQDDALGAWVHAYLHRKEGDAANAGYWYRRAARPVATTTLDNEWSEIVGPVLSGSERATPARP